jgi:hypothetical protein
MLELSFWRWQQELIDVAGSEVQVDQRFLVVALFLSDYGSPEFIYASPSQSPRGTVGQH